MYIYNLVSINSLHTKIEDSLDRDIEHSPYTYHTMPSKFRHFVSCHLGQFKFTGKNPCVTVDLLKYLYQLITIQ